MTLLVTVVGKDFALSATDTRISKTINNKIIPTEERFNKSIVFKCAGFTGCISFTGLAEWMEGVRKVRMYDAVADSLQESISVGLTIGQLSKKLGDDIRRRILTRKAYKPERDAIFEFHINGWQSGIPHGFLVVVSTFRSHSPWMNPNDFELEKHEDGIHLYMKSVDDFELVVGGQSQVFYRKDQQRLCDILRKGGGSFEVSQFIAKIIETASTRTKAVGSRSVAVLIPKVGVLDTNAWDSDGSQVIGYMPKILFENGSRWETTEFPVNLNVVTSGRLPKHSLFIKSILAKQLKRADRRKVFKTRQGKFVPGIFSIVQLCLFGNVPDGYDDFGLSSAGDAAVGACLPIEDHP